MFRCLGLCILNELILSIKSICSDLSNAIEIYNFTHLVLIPAICSVALN